VEPIRRAKSSKAQRCMTSSSGILLRELPIVVMPFRSVPNGREFVDSQATS
jgi:hypothetical protein